MTDTVKNPMKVTPMNAIKSKCHECMGQFVDGRRDCENTACSLYSYMRYAKKTPDLEWTKYSPSASGFKERVKRELSEEERAVIRERFELARAAR